MRNESTTPVVKKIIRYDGDLHRLTPTEVKFLSYLVTHRDKSQPALAKREYAELFGCNAKTLDRTVSSLKRRGLVEVVPRFGETGGQLSNAYRMSSKMEVALQAQ